MAAADTPLLFRAVSKSFARGSQRVQALDQIDLGLVPGTITAVVNGVSTDYTVARNPACSTCGGGTRMTGWDPFPDASYVEEPRQQVALAQRATSARQMTGLIPQRYTRR